MPSDRDHMFGPDDDAHPRNPTDAPAEAAGDADRLEFDAASGAAALDAREPFWKNVLGLNGSSWTGLAEPLNSGGVNLPPPESLDDDALNAKLSELAESMPGANVFLDRADHASDRAVYEQIYQDALHATAPSPLPAAAEPPPLPPRGGITAFNSLRPIEESQAESLDPAAPSDEELPPEHDSQL